MSALKEKIHTLLHNFLGGKDSLDLQEFLALFEELKPDYDLSEDEVRDIFEMTDEHGEGLIPKSEVERILTAVVTSEDDEKKSFVSDYVNELKAGLAQSAERGSYTSVLEDFETANQESSSQPNENTNSALKILHHLDLDKISELKNIYNICNTQNRGYVGLDQLRKVVPTMDNLTCPQDEILELFEYIAEGESRIIPKQTFSNLMGELEKKLLDYLITEENEMMNDLDQQKPDEKEPNEYNTRNFNGVVSSEIFSNSSDKEEYESANSASEADVKHQTRLIVQKAKNIIEGIKSKTRSEDVITMLHEIINVSSSLDHQFKHNEGKIKSLEQELDEQKNTVDGLNSKVYNFQFTLKNQEQTIYKLQADNDQLNQQISHARNEGYLKEQAEAELKEKNNEIVRLERNLNEVRNERATFIRNIQNIENEKHTLMESYKELELLIKKNDQDKREQENIVGAELKKLEERISIERDSLNSQTKTLKDQKLSLENDIRNLQATLGEYREQMTTTKEFVDNLNTQKKDLERQIHKLNEEQANLAIEVSRLEFSVQNSPRKNLEFISPFGDSGLTTRHLDQQYHSGFTTMSTPRALNFQFDLKKVDEEEEKSRIAAQTEEPKIPERVSERKESAISEKKEPEIQERKQSVPKTPKTEPNKIQAMDSLLKSKDQRSSAKRPNAFAMNLLRPAEPVRPKALAYNVEVIEASPIIRPTRKSTMHKHNELLAIIDKRKITMDYLSIRNKEEIITILQKNNEMMKERIFYSDYVYDINKEGKREHHIIFVTGEALYCLNKNYNVQRRIPLKQIHRITINQSSAGICAFHVYDDLDYLIDTYRRLELIIFLKTVFKYKGMRPFAIFFEKNFLIHNPNSQHVSHFNKKMFNPEMQSTYQNVQKIGELYLKEWSIFNPWNKYFFILTQVGLFYFKEPGSLKPLGFIPILDYLLVNKKETPYSERHEFRIKFQYSDFSVSLAAESELEKLEWVVAIHQVQNKAQPKDILTMIKDA